MEAIFNAAFLIGLFTATVRMMVPILLAALGEAFSERSGVLNIGLEGIMLIGAFGGFVGAYYSGSVAVGILCGALCGRLLFQKVAR